jgi:integrase
MKWTDVDFENRLITINPEVIKGRRVHIFSMSDQVIELLTFLKKGTGSMSYALLAEQISACQSENTVPGVIRRIGY